MKWAAGAGLPLPASIDYRCPSAEFPHHGTACWEATPCPRRGFIAINLQLIGDATPEYLRYVVAHELCHIRDFQTKGKSSEESADACAAAHGAPA